MTKKSIGVFLIAYFVVASVAVNLPSSLDDLHFLARFFIGLGVMSGFVLWVWMLTDFFSRKELGGKIIWGWCLLFLNLYASIVYFFFVFYPNEKGN